jgi:hypothetical protein
MNNPQFERISHEQAAEQIEYERALAEFCELTGWTDAGIETQVQTAFYAGWLAGRKHHVKK